MDARKKAEEAAKVSQATLDAHLKERTTKERNIKYSEGIFRKAVVEWLICTDQVCIVCRGVYMPCLWYSYVLFSQPISAVEHPKFRQMIEIAAASTKGASIPSRKAARAEIMRMFNTEMDGLRKKLNNVRYLILCSISSDENSCLALNH